MLEVPLSDLGRPGVHTHEDILSKTDPDGFSPDLSSIREQWRKAGYDMDRVGGG